MAQPRGQPPEGGEVVVTPQGVPVLVQRVFDSAEAPTVSCSAGATVGARAAAVSSVVIHWRKTARLWLRWTSGGGASSMGVSLRNSG